MTPPIKTPLRFKKKNWSEFETWLRHRLTCDAISQGEGMTQYLTNIIRSKHYPRGVETTYKVYLCLSIIYPDELLKFTGDTKGKFEGATPISITTQYFIRVMTNICKSYGINLSEVAKQT